MCFVGVCGRVGAGFDDGAFADPVPGREGVDRGGLGQGRVDRAPVTGRFVAVLSRGIDHRFTRVRRRRIHGRSPESIKFKSEK